MNEKSVGQPLPRADGRAKVTGAARYVADTPKPILAHAVLVPSQIACGRLLAIDTRDAQAAPGVLAVLTHQNMPKLGGAAVLLSQSAGPNAPQGAAGQQFLPMQGDVIHYSGQPVALVIAKTEEQAGYAVELVKAKYQAAPPATDLETARAHSFSPVNGWPEPAVASRGNAAQGMAESQTCVSAVYHTALQHHVAMEPHATLAYWDGDSLTLEEPTTWVEGVQQTVAAWLGMPEVNIRVTQQFVGGSFGCKGPAWPHVALAAVAARQVARPVRLVLTRSQTFWSNGYRPRIRHLVALGAQADGTLTALRHEAVTHTAPFDNRIVAPVTKTSLKVYACPNAATDYHMAHLNLCGPFTMRGPGETPGLFALECAMDELAYALDMDPMALRLKNYAETDPDSGKLWSSKSLRRCYAEGAARFGWDKRTPQPRSMTAAGGKSVGWGMATMMYDAFSSPASASARLSPDGSVLIRSATCDQGTGSYTIMPQIAADALGIPAASVRMQLGDTNLPKAPISAGSRTAASVGAAVQAAAQSLRRRALAFAFADPTSPLHGQSESTVTVEHGRISLNADPARGQNYAEIAAIHAPGGLEVTEAAKPDDETKFSAYSFGAHFAEVQVDPDLGEVRVTRYVGAFGAGRILNAQTARSQLIGGVVWGLGMALTEETHLHPKLGRIANADLAEYHVPVNADVPSLDVFFVDEDDPYVNPLGIKGIGEIGTIGAAAAVANAVYHATGRRIRDLPITPDKLI